MRLYISFSLLVVSLYSFAEDKKTVQITSGEYMPWSSETAKHEGFAHHIIREAFKRNGYSSIFLFHPWARSYKEGASGKYHAAAHWTCTPKRAKIFHCSEPIYEEDYVFFHFKLRPVQWETLDDLNQYRIGATRGYAYSAEFWKAHKTGRLNIIVNNSDEINFNMLFKKRIDIFPMGSVSGYSFLLQKYSNTQVQTLTYNSKPLITYTNHLLFPKKRADAQQLLKTFNAGLKSMRDDGTYEKYYDLLLEGYYDQP
ncbi:substrate-binding periplasmic protein [Spartinivicinus ruber]|uniref:substrate-binding periplasmic protein n=1 Tax=Spartinivicinus ruber TaxID=2683272 RepID=UPI0013CFBFD3|nr:transporter substrate-binding domain-containing protein [Spartinivicinus ruber]